MNIAILSDCRLPTTYYGGHGLGRVAWDMAEGLHKRGHAVTLYGHPKSCGIDGVALVAHADENARATQLAQQPPQVDVYLDLSHHKRFGLLRPDLPVLSYIVDSECLDAPDNAAVATESDRRKHYPGARILRTGIDVDAIPLNDKPRDENFLAVVARIVPHKGIDEALLVHQGQRIPVRFIGAKEPGYDPRLPFHTDEVGNPVILYTLIGNAFGLLQCARLDIGGGRVQLEAAACGTPTLVFDNGCADHVKHGVSGWVVRDVNEMIDAVRDLKLIRPATARAWVADTHDLKHMIDDAETLLTAVADGQRWKTYEVNSGPCA
jgi:glycosyltransferase involved in cell wall biosynthesis